MPETKKKSPFVARIPELTRSKWGGMKPQEAEALVSEIVKGGKGAILPLIDGLDEVDTGADWKERLLLHQLVTQMCGPDRENDRRILAELYVEAVGGERPGTVKAFLLQQLRLIADDSSVLKLVPHLSDDDPLVVDAAAAALVSIGSKARKPLEGALPSAKGHRKVAIKHALHQLG